jgi:hypothetical protein
LHVIDVIVWDETPAGYGQLEPNASLLTELAIVCDRRPTTALRTPTAGGVINGVGARLSL